MTFPEPLISIAIAPRTKADHEKLAQGLFRLVAEGPALRVKSGETPGDVSRTRGRGTYSMEFDRYLPCPPPEGDNGGLASFVRAPRKPGPFRHGRVALPEPDDDGWRAR